MNNETLEESAERFCENHPNNRPRLNQKDVISEWWDTLSNEEMREVFIKTGNFRLGGWGHDIGPTEEDIKDMYLEVHNLSSKQDNTNIYKIIIQYEIE